MQKVASILPSWDKTKTGSKKGFDKVWGWADKLGAPVNRLTNKIGSEAFWPTTLDKESDKAARILRSFCKDGFYAPADPDDYRPVEGPTQKQKVLKKIPQSVIQNAVGLAIFTTMRTGLWVSGAGGSGVLIARKDDGTWSPPSGIMLHTAGLGFLVGIDIYDCVVVINNRKALESFTKVRATVGGEISAVAGPVGMGGVLEHDGKWKQVNKPVFTYLKSRGFYAGVQIDGTVVIERTDENERFYGERIGVKDILAGKTRYIPRELKMLMETIKAAEGRDDVDQRLMDELADQPAPGDVGLEPPTREISGPIFGLPEPDDPDPFGVLALQKAGLEIKEAGSGSRPSSTQFEFKPSTTSPIYAHFRKRSMDTNTIGTTSNRGSFTSHRRQWSVDRATQTAEIATQTDPHDLDSPNTSPSVWNENKNVIEEEETVKEPEEIDYTKIDLGPYSNLNRSESEFHSSGTTATDRDHDTWSDVRHSNEAHSPASAHSPESDAEHNEAGPSGHNDSDADIDADDEEEEPVVFEVAAVQATGVSVLRPINIHKARGSLVDIPKRSPPPLPPRNPIRSSRGLSGVSPLPSPIKDGFPSPVRDGFQSPVKDGFEEVDLDGSTRVTSMHEVIAGGAKGERVEGLGIVDGLEMADAGVGNDMEDVFRNAANEMVGSPVLELQAAHADEVQDEVQKIEKVDTHEHKSEEGDDKVATVISTEQEEKEKDKEGIEKEKENGEEDFHSIPTTPNQI